MRGGPQRNHRKVFLWRGKEKKKRKSEVAEFANCYAMPRGGESGPFGHEKRKKRGRQIVQRKGECLAQWSKWEKEGGPIFKFYREGKKKKTGRPSPLTERIL